MRKRLHLVILIMCVFLVTGCNKSSSKYTATENTLYITKDYHITTVMYESLGYYGGIDTFNTLDDSRMIEYNYSVKGIAVERKSSEVVDNRIKYVTRYNSFFDYAAYCGIEFMTGTLEEALVVYDIDKIEFTDTTGNKVLGETLKQNTGYYIIIIQQGIDIEIDGKVVYYTDNVSLSGDGHVTTTADEISYIIFK